MSDDKNSPPSAPQGFWSGLGHSFTQQIGIAIIAAVVGILGLFSDNLAGRIKFALNRADARGDIYATLSSQLSSYIFDCELVEEHLANGWTTKDELTPIIGDYNKDITELRKKEYANRALIAKYWNKERREEFAALMKEILTIDSAVHRLNDELEQVTILKKKEKIDPARAKASAAELQKLLGEFEPQAEKLFNELE
jgi:hypothetical protein